MPDCSKGSGTDLQGMIQFGDSKQRSQACHFWRHLTRGVNLCYNIRSKYGTWGFQENSIVALWKECAILDFYALMLYCDKALRYVRQILPYDTTIVKYFYKIKKGRHLVATQFITLCKTLVSIFQFFARTSRFRLLLLIDSHRL